ncbi:MAG: hypothetical protein WAM04_12685 [Candidatus Sulfotelmatobacter sp.]|jgi:hypothetical protein
MYVITVILFLIPFSILGIASRDELRRNKAAEHPDWRSYCLRLALIVGTLAALAAMSFWFSWTHSGGSPHGLMPAPGPWLILRRIAKWLVVITVALGVIAKGKGRLLVIGSAVSIVCVIFLLAFLEID